MKKHQSSAEYQAMGLRTAPRQLRSDIEVKPTIKGIREGRDELLESAVSIINEN